MRRRGYFAVIVLAAAACARQAGPERVQVQDVPAASVVVVDAASAPPEPLASTVPAEPPPALVGVDPALAHQMVVLLNLASVRKHPVLRRLEPVLEAIPPVASLRPKTLDLIRDVDWVLVYGPSFVHTNRVVTLVRYNIADKAIDDAVAAAAAAQVGDHEHGPWDAGVPGTGATIVFGDHAPRVCARPQSKLLLISAPEDAPDAIRFFQQSPPQPPPNEAMRITIRDPHRHIGVPGFAMPDELEVLRFSIEPAASGGAVVNVEGEASTESAAAKVADSWNKRIKDVDTSAVRLSTRGLIGKMRFVNDTKTVRMHVDASPEQTESIAELVAAQLRVQLAPPSSP